MLSGKTLTNIQKDFVSAEFQLILILSGLDLTGTGWSKQPCRLLVTIAIAVGETSKA